MAVRSAPFTLWLAPSRSTADDPMMTSLIPPCWPRLGFIRLWVWWCALRWFLRPTFWSICRSYFIVFEVLWTGVYYWLQRPGNSLASIEASGLEAVTVAALTALIPSIPISLFFAAWWTFRSRKAGGLRAGLEDWEKELETSTGRLTDARNGLIIARSAGGAVRRRGLASLMFVLCALIINGVCVGQISVRIEPDRRLFALVPLTALDLFLINGYRRLLRWNARASEETFAPRVHPHSHRRDEGGERES